MSEFRRRLMMALSDGVPPVAPVFYTYLVFDGVARIQTDIQFPANGSCRVHLGNEATKAGSKYVITVYGSASGSGAVRYLYGGNTSSSQRQMCVFYDSTSIVNGSRYLAYTYNSYGYFLTPKRQGNGDSAQTFTKGSATHPDGGIMLGHLKNDTVGYGYDGTMQTFYLYGSDAQNCKKYTDFNSYTPVATLRPCTYNGEAGFWCVETSTFYGNTYPSGTLIARD